MGSYEHDLSRALGAGRHDKATLKPYVLRLTASMKERTESRDDSSLEFIKSAVHSIARLNPSICTSQCYDSLSYAVQYLHAHGELATALTASEQMLRLALQVDKRELMRRAETFVGIVQKGLGNFTDALVHYQRALSFARDLCDSRAEGLTLTNVGSLLLEANMYVEAKGCLQRASDILQDPQDRNVAQFNLAILHWYMGNPKEALVQMRTTLDNVWQPASAQMWYSRTLRHAQYVYVAVELGELAEARKHVALCGECAAKTGTRPSLFFARLATGLCAVREGRIQDGIADLHVALDEGRAIGSPSLTGDALGALAWAYESMNQPDRALHYVRKLIQNIAHTRRMCLDAFQEQSAVRRDDEFSVMPLKLREANLEAASARMHARATRLELLERLAMAASLRDDPSGLHGFRVGRLSGLLAARIGWPPDRCYELEIAARLHDIGKSALPDHILLRSGPLKNAEREFIRSHPQVGASLLDSASDSESRVAADIALYHHEHWNGNGYPKGLVAERIPLAARIVAIADVFDALTHGRPYAAAWSVENALSELRTLTGSQFDPDLVEPFIRLIVDLNQTHPCLDTYLEASAQSSPFVSARKKIQAMILDAQNKVRAASD